MSAVGAGDATPAQPGAERHPGPDDSAWAGQVREQLAEADAGFAARFDEGAEVDRLVAERAAVVDTHVQAAWQRCIPLEAQLALFAVGGYGRGELFPQSDVDLLVLAEPEASTACADALARFFAVLWDAGLPVGHAVRSLEQCTEASREDISVLTSLLEARPLAANELERRELQTAASPRLVWPPQDFFEAKRRELRDRHARYGDTSDNLEPNLKEGPGGLRDVQTLHWMALRIIGTADLEALVAFGQLGADEVTTLERERRALSRLRFGLHLVADKREERLRFDYQKPLAARLGFEDTGDTLAVEQMMQGFYRSAAIVLRIGERLLQRFEEQLEGEAEPEPIDERFDLRRGYLAASSDAWPRDLGDVFDLFATWAAHADAVRGLHSHTARELAEALPRLPGFKQASAELRQRFMQLLRGPQPVQTLTRMARLGVLGRWIPAFARVSGRMQFDLFHVYTVDQHTLAVLKNLASFASGQRDERFAMAHEVWPRLRKPELLLLAGLFHDIAKGRGGDHSELGGDDAREFCETVGLSAPDTAMVEWLVRQHLLMSRTAQKEDITEPEVIHRFAAKVADREHLDHLYLLTCADIAGTSPKLWNAWKDRLMADLYTATRLAMRRGLEHPVALEERIAEIRDTTRAMLSALGHDDAAIDEMFARMPDAGFQRGRPDQLAWQAVALRGIGAGDTRVRARPVTAQAGALEVFVYSPNRDGLFAAIVAKLDRLGLAILQARVLDGPDGTIFDTFEVIPSDPRYTPTADEVERKLAAALDGPLDRIRPARRTQPRHLKHFRIPPQVAFDEGSDGRTTLSFVCTDRPGLLAEVAAVLRNQSLRVHDARIATFGERAEDVFQLTTSDPEGRGLPLDDAHQQALREALLHCFEGESA
ncbi:[protein-PII] uridylyltransferase [Novilysobacter selenitireducens]|uniref:Bifunctional uridylyltransferase/uridylyl-removing enzyme n=1 Tax=Novilysobacter selenitireducens TaxID=2872639 RepID=A0ABS7T796_9GAMM|nr:[protein-PII] uridylyltransferase [Lysobacter selenitireducens]MBZ4039723.1 [protein-PII] uridylyltransferase [Lysobacter selenitireducens]